MTENKIENKWINVNLYCYYLCEDEVDEILKEKYNITLPNLPSSLEELAMSEIKINNKSLIDFANKNKIYTFIQNGFQSTQFISEEYLKSFKDTYVYREASETKKSKIKKLAEDYKKYKKFVEKKARIYKI